MCDAETLATNASGDSKGLAIGGVQKDLYGGELGSGRGVEYTRNVHALIVVLNAGLLIT